MQSPVYLLNQIQCLKFKIAKKSPVTCFDILLKIVNLNNFYTMDTINPYTKESSETELLLEENNGCQLIVWNDEVTTFDWVITTLIEVCNHVQEQAEQCAMIIHTKGKYSVKEGSYEFLKPMCDNITDRGIGATVEQLSEH